MPGPQIVDYELILTVLNICRPNVNPVKYASRKFATQIYLTGVN